LGYRAIRADTELLLELPNATASIDRLVIAAQLPDGNLIEIAVYE